MLCPCKVVQASPCLFLILDLAPWPWNWFSTMIHSFALQKKFCIWTTLFPSSLSSRFWTPAFPFLYNSFLCEASCYYQVQCKLPEPQPRAKPSGPYLLRKGIWTSKMLQENQEKMLPKQRMSSHMCGYMNRKPSLLWQRWQSARLDFAYSQALQIVERFLHPQSKQFDCV